MALSTLNSLRDVYTLFSLKDEKQIIEMLQEEKFLRPLKCCSKCRTMNKLVKNKAYKGTNAIISKFKIFVVMQLINLLLSTGGYAAHCQKCKKFTKLTDGSFFEGTQIPFEDFFVVLWFWASDASVKVVCNCTNYTKVQVVQYYRYFR